MSRKRNKSRFPWWGYVAVNLTFLAFFVAVYWLSFAIGSKKDYAPVAVFPVLLVAYLAVTVACIYDALHDRFSEGLAKANAESARGKPRDHLRP